MKFLMFDMGLFIGWFTIQLVHEFTRLRGFWYGWSFVSALVCRVIRVSPAGGGLYLVLHFGSFCSLCRPAVGQFIRTFYQGHCSRFLAQLHSWHILRIVLWKVHCIYALCEFYKFISPRVHQFAVSRGKGGIRSTSLRGIIYNQHLVYPWFVSP